MLYKHMEHVDRTSGTLPFRCMHILLYWSPFQVVLRKSAMIMLQFLHRLQWTLSAMMSKSKNGSNSWGILYEWPLERLTFCYDRHEELTRYVIILMRDVHYHPMVLRVFCLPVKIFG